MPHREIKAVYTPFDEPYLGDEHLHSFDEAIPPAMVANLAVARRTFGLQMSPLQKAASEIIPQGISIALSIRELVRQAYLYSAGILVRPLVERTATVYWLRDNPQSVLAWHGGWSRKDQPTLEQLLTHLHPGHNNGDLGTFRVMMHKLMHADPAGAMYNMLQRSDGQCVFPTGKIVDDPKMCSFLGIMGEVYLRKLIVAAEELFPEGKTAS
jgi:hypothetical protein